MVHSKGNILPDMVSKSLRDAVFEIVLALFATKLRKILLPRLHNDKDFNQDPPFLWLLLKMYFLTCENHISPASQLISRKLSSSNFAAACEVREWKYRLATSAPHNFLHIARRTKVRA
jgi:hypothetical protein